MSKKKTSLTRLRHISDDLVAKYKKSKLHDLVKNDESMLACIRNNAIGIYYNSDRVAMVRLKDDTLSCEISSYYLSDYYLTGTRTKSEIIFVTADEIQRNIDIIKYNSAKRGTPEKKAQQYIVYQNNLSKESDWYCFDIEYRQPSKVQRGSSTFDGRFDILAVSKSAPHRIAIIELKYGRGAIGGKSGVVKHLKDFKKFSESESCKENLKREIPAILQNLKDLGYDIPEELDHTSLCFENEIEFYVVCLYEDESPKGTVGGYLFNEIRSGWDTKKISRDNAVKALGLDVESPTCPIDVKFLFKKVASPTDFTIIDILDSAEYDK